SSRTTANRTSAAWSGASSSICSVRVTWSSPPAAARSSIRRTARSSTATASPSGSTSPSHSSSIGCRPTGGGRSPPTANGSSVSTRRAGRRTSTRTSGWTPAARPCPLWWSSCWTSWRSDVRYLAVSDIHGNLDALDAVLTALEGRYDEVLVLGDLVGYGADPNGVVDRVRSLPTRAVIRGNHDKVAA